MLIPILEAIESFLNTNSFLKDIKDLFQFCLTENRTSTPSLSQIRVSECQNQGQCERFCFVFNLSKMRHSSPMSTVQ